MVLACVLARIRMRIEDCLGRTMGKKQHSKDQLYLTQTEWAHEWGGAKTNRHLPHKVRTQQCRAAVPLLFNSSWQRRNRLPELREHRAQVITAPRAARRHPNPYGATCAGASVRLLCHILPPHRGNDNGHQGGPYVRLAQHCAVP